MSSHPKLVGSFLSFFPSIAIKFSELEKLNVANVPRNGKQYYLHPPTFQTFCYCLTSNKWYDVSTTRNWKKVYETGNFLC